MNLRNCRSTLLPAYLLLLGAATAQGQNGGFTGPTTAAPPTPAMRFFGGNYQAPAPPVFQRPAPPTPPQQAESKPFENFTRRPAISPYLNLDRIESGVSLPNYHAFVRPQMEHEQLLQQQETELRRLRQQVRLASAVGIVTEPPRRNSMPTTGNSGGQFLNTGGFYPGPR